MADVTLQLVKLAFQRLQVGEPPVDLNPPLHDAGEDLPGKIDAFRRKRLLD